MIHALELHDAAAARAIDRAATEELGIAGIELMERAGRAAWRLLRQRWPRARRIGVAAGSGNNGGDAYVVARLARQAGLEVHVLCVGPPGTASARTAADACRASGAEAAGWDAAVPLPAVDLWVDGVLGIGLSRAPTGAVAGLIDALNGSGVPVLALDLPSGVAADDASTPGVVIGASATIQFIVAKRGLYTGAGRVASGERSLDALGLAPALFERHAAHARSFCADQLDDFFPPRHRGSHKGHHGRVLCIGGDHGMGGAIRLCAEAALRCGSGLVTVATRPAHVGALLSARPELMVHGVDAAEAISGLVEGADVLALGPGLGQRDWGRSLFGAALGAGKPCVIDADALHLLAGERSALPGRCVLTPHPGEAARLLDCAVADVEADRFEAVRALASRFECAVVLKGAGSLVAVEGEPVAVVDAGNPGMAVGGMGDVLTGLVASLLGQGLTPFRAALAGALVHAVAGDDAAAGGERGLLPLDLMAAIRRRVNPRSRNDGR